MIHCTLLSHIGLVHVIDWVKMAVLIVVFQDFQRYFFFKTDNKFCRTEGKSANKDCRPQNCICRHLREKLHKGLLSLTVHQNL